MADIALTTANKIEVVESFIQMTLPAAEAVTAGMAVRIDASGLFTKANGTTNAEADAWGIATRTVAAGEPVTAIRSGVLDGYVLAGAYSSAVYLSNTDGRLADAAGTVGVAVGRVIPATATTTGTAYDKLLEVNMAAAGGGTVGSEEAQSERSVTTDLMAASVDKWVFVADRAYRVELIEEIHSVVGGSGAAVSFRKVTAAGTAAPGAAAGATVVEFQVAAIDLTATINVTQTPALSAVAGALNLADGDKIGTDFAGTLTGLVGHATITLTAI
jgi:hypothetical protein